MTTQDVSTLVDATEGNSEAETAVLPQKLTTDQEINALRGVHDFLSQFDRVPGFLANKWSQALDAVAVVANSLIAKAAEENAATSNSTTGADSADSTQPQ